MALKLRKATKRKMTYAEQALHNKLLNKSKVTPEDYRKAGVSAPTSQVKGATGREGGPNAPDSFKNITTNRTKTLGEENKSKFTEAEKRKNDTIAFEEKNKAFGRKVTNRLVSVVRDTNLPEEERRSAQDRLQKEFGIGFGNDPINESPSIVRLGEGISRAEADEHAREELRNDPDVIAASEEFKKGRMSMEELLDIIKGSKGSLEERIAEARTQAGERASDIESMEGPISEEEIVSSGEELDPNFQKGERDTSGETIRLGGPKQEEEKSIITKFFESLTEDLFGGFPEGVVSNVVPIPLAPIGGPKGAIGGAGKIVKALTRADVSASNAKLIAEAAAGKTTFLGPKVKDLAKGAKGIVQRVDVDKLGAALKLTETQTAAVAKELGRQRVFNIAKNALSDPTFLKTGRVAINAKTLGLKTGYLTKMVATLKNPTVVLGLIGSALYFSLWGQNEKGDAMTSLSMAQREAAEMGEVEMVNKLAEQLEEADEIMAGLPFIGFLNAEKAKFGGIVSASNTYVELAIKQREKNQKALDKEEERANEPTFSEQRKTADEESRNRTLANREEDTRFFDKQKEKRREDELEQRKEDEEFYEDIEEENKKRDLDKRAQEFDDRLADSEYFKLIREKKYDEAEDLLKKQIEEFKRK